MVDWKIEDFGAIWNAVDPAPIESEVVYPLKGLALRVRASMISKPEKKQMKIDLRIVEPTRLNSKWSLNARYGPTASTDRYFGHLSKQFLLIYYFISLVCVRISRTIFTAKYLSILLATTIKPTFRRYERIYIRW